MAYVASSSGFWTLERTYAFSSFSGPLQASGGELQRRLGFSSRRLKKACQENNPIILRSSKLKRHGAAREGTAASRSHLLWLPPQEKQLIWVNWPSSVHLNNSHPLRFLIARSPTHIFVILYQNGNCPFRFHSSEGIADDDALSIEYGRAVVSEFRRNKGTRNYFFGPTL